MGGDILPSPLKQLSAPDVAHEDFINQFLVKELLKLKEELGDAYPRIFLILGNDDGRMEEAAILDADTGETLLTFPHPAGVVWGSTFSPDGTRLATAGADNTARVWDANNGQELLTLPVPSGGHLDGSEFANQGR